MEETVDYKKRCEEYEKRMGIGQHDPAKTGYLVLVNIIHQQNSFLQDFVLKSKITSDESGDKVAYKNAKDLWENLPDLIKKVTALRIELKMDGEEKRTEYKPISAKEIANSKI